ncbi:Uncharacterised protein [Leminorella richardii]|uniref:Uncharacterized protein n=1 Tax=Leminorella richardii TaxID=158841 RepID=A0A2X4V3K1_9GAMM|nr:Uncharacterised protein [Leminorella richardii]
MSVVKKQATILTFDRLNHKTAYLNLCKEPKRKKKRGLAVSESGV